MQKILEGASIVLGVFVVFIVQNSYFVTYSTYLLAILIIFSSIYISLKRRSNKSLQLFAEQPIEIFAVTSIIVFIIALTNGLFSPLFFFLYFLLFLFAFMCQPFTVWIFLASIILYFIPQALNNFTIDTFIKLGSLILIAPIAYFIGYEFERRDILAKRITSKTDEIIQEAQLLKGDDNLKGADETEAVDEIIEEAQSLRDDALK